MKFLIFEDNNIRQKEINMVNVSRIEILLQKVPQKKISAAEVGYVCPDGAINFKTSNTAYTYAKNRVLQALHTPKPFERGLIIKGTSVIKEIDGNYLEVNVKTRDAEDADCFIHGHIIDTPLSLEDLTALLRTKHLKSIVALNRKGEYSKFEIKSSKWENVLPRKFRQKLERYERIYNAKDAENDYNNYMAKSHEEFNTGLESISDEINQIMNNASDNTFIKISNWLDRFQYELVSDADEIPEDIRPVFEKFISFIKEDINKSVFKIHQFWEKYSHKYNVRYDTNYTNLNG